MDTTRAPLAHGTFARRWAGTSLLFIVLCGLWSLSTPIPSGPDEPTQYVKAAAVAHGTLIGDRPAGFPRGTALVHVQGTFVMYDPSTFCYYLHPQVPAGCTVAPGPDATLRSTTTYVGGYPPLYYALTGLPTLLSSRPLARRAMRAVSAVLSAVLLGAAISAAVTWSRSRWLVIGAAFTITPTAVYLASVLNPNGLEISAALAAWTTGVLLVFHHADRPPGGLVAVFAGSLVILALTRPLSPLWAGEIVAVLIVMRPDAARHLIRGTPMRVGLSLAALAMACAAVFVVAFDSLAIEKFPLAPGLSNLQVGALVAGQIPLHLRSMVGQFGAPEFTAPGLAVLIWVVGVGALVCVALSVSPRKDAALLALLVVGVLVLLPFLASFPGARTRGLAWQGRYQYPAAAGIPLLSAALLGEARVKMGRAGNITVVAVVIGHLASYYWVLRRYTVGLGPFVNPFARVPGGWSPPLSPVLLTSLVTVAAVGSALWLAARLGGLPLETGGPAEPPVLARTD
ncbi:MAG: DUF2142 domain-containing protein [Acidimicrobiales bacterium]